MEKPMTLQQLKYFCVMAKTLHYTKAASILYVSQPSLSHAIAGIEKGLGVPLFEKKGKKTFLTKYGEAFLPYAQNAIKSISDGEAAIMKMTEANKGNVNIGYIYSAGSRLVSKLAEDFYVNPANKSINFNFTENISSRLFTQVLEGSLDFIFTSPIDSDLVENIPIYEQEFFLVVSDQHNLAKRKKVSLDEINGENFIAISPNTSLRVLIDKFLKDCDVAPKIVAEVDKCNMMARLAEANLGVTIMPRISSLNGYNVSTIPVSGVKMSRQICMIYKKGQHMQASAQHFRDFVIERKRNEE
jgi:DNA-binding transcriptional LysR family regulator